MEWGKMSKPCDDWGPSSQTILISGNNETPEQTIAWKESGTPKPAPCDAGSPTYKSASRESLQRGKERIRLEDGRLLEVTMPSGLVLAGQRIRLGQGIVGGGFILTIEFSGAQAINFIVLMA
jgi:hypothetical protein